MPSEDENRSFNEARRIESDDQRKAFVERACGPDEQLKQRVEEMLGETPKYGGSVESPTAAVKETEFMPASTNVGDWIGKYKLMEQIGAGGMGVVYVAEQQQPIRRRVAIKVIKPGMDSREVIARFDAERQALAMMDHPHIAKVHDADMTQNGRPYFVMELV